jgi:alpha-beta hydrolase superfamily lysophospholipase
MNRGIDTGGGARESAGHPPGLGVDLLPDAHEWLALRPESPAAPIAEEGVAESVAVASAEAVTLEPIAVAIEVPSVALPSEDTTRPWAVPLVFGPAGRSLFGMYHPAAAAAGVTPAVRRSAVVLCNPLGYEAICSYRAYCHLAERLAAAGFPVLRFDYHGTGDSSGQDGDAERVRAWLDSIAAAVGELRTRSGRRDVSLFGVRVGATLAAAAAVELGAVANLVLWAPCPTGRGYVREMRAAHLIKQNGTHPSPHPGDVDGDLEASGYLLTRSTIEELSKLDLAGLPAPLAERVLVLARGNLPVEERLTAQLEACGNSVSYRNVPGFAEMMVDQVHRSVVPSAVIEAIVDWMMTAADARGALEPGTEPDDSSRSEVGARTWHAPLATVDSALPWLRPSPARDALDGEPLSGGSPHLVDPGPHRRPVREEPVMFGSRPRLFGILTEPADDAPVVGGTAAGRRPAVLMLNVGTNHRVGPNRLYVKMARAWGAQGFSVLRFDLAGIGDSRLAEGYVESRLYSKESVTDVQAAMSFMQRFRGIDRFVLVGLCSGAYVAFHAALADPRVAGEVLINPATFSWKPGDPLDAAMQTVYKSTRFYRRALFQGATWRRALRGELDLRGIADRLRVLALARARAALDGLLTGGREEGLARSFRRLSDRGCDSLLIYGQDDQGLDYLESHLGAKARRLGALPHFRVDVIDGPDHTFTQLWAQSRLTEFITAHLNRRFG